MARPERFELPTFWIPTRKDVKPFLGIAISPYDQAAPRPFGRGSRVGRRARPCVPAMLFLKSPLRRVFVLECVASGRGSAWLERLVRDQEVGGSNPLAPTILFYNLCRADPLH